MYRRLSVPISLTLILAISAVSAMAQSGRGRQLRIQQMLPDQNEVATPATAEIQPASSETGTASALTKMPVRNSTLIYNDAASVQKKDNGDYHMTKGDKRAGWILLGVLTLVTVSLIANGGDF